MKKIMLVDDDKEFLNEMSEILKLSGYETFVFSDSTDAATKAINLKPDLILLDLKMDNKSGFKVADELRSITATKDIPVIAVTGVFTKKEHKLLMKVCNIRESLIKPIQPLDLISRIENILK